MVTAISIFPYPWTDSILELVPVHIVGVAEIEEVAPQPIDHFRSGSEVLWSVSPLREVAFLLHLLNTKGLIVIQEIGLAKELLCPLREVLDLADKFRKICNCRRIPLKMIEWALWLSEAKHPNEK